jgi:hypothetical protein
VGSAAEELAGARASLPDRVGRGGGMVEQTRRHRSVRDLVASIRTCITNWNDDTKPFVWHKTADQILDSLAAYCQRINDSGH